jgi:hypothetical protein
MKHASIMAMTVVKEERLVLYDGVEMCLERVIGRKTR